MFIGLLALSGCSGNSGESKPSSGGSHSAGNTSTGGKSTTDPSLSGAGNNGVAGTLAGAGSSGDTKPGGNAGSAGAIGTASGGSAGANNGSGGSATTPNNGGGATASAGNNAGGLSGAAGGTAAGTVSGDSAGTNSGTTGGSGGETATGGTSTGGIAGTPATTGGVAGSGTSTVVVPGNPITLTVIANPDPAVANAPIYYEFKVSNLGSTTISNIVLTDTTQNAANAYPSQTTGGATCNGASACGPGSIVTWPSFALAPGQTQTFWMTSGVTNGTPNGTVIHNTATVTMPSANAVVKSTDVLVDSSVNLHVGIASDRDPVHAGDEVTYTVSVGNTSSQTLPLSLAGVLTATLPAGSTFVSATFGGTAVNGSVQWNINSIDPGAGQRYTFKVKIDPGAVDGTVITSLAQVSDGGTSLARATTMQEVRTNVPLSLAVIPVRDPVAQNGAIFYEVKISNNGTTTLSNVVLTNVTQGTAVTYPSQTTGVGACSGASACGNGTIVTWPAFTLVAGQTQTVWLTGAVSNATASGSLIRNQTTLSYPGGFVLNAEDLVVNNAANLHLGITADRDPVHAGDQVEYTIVAGNTGSASLPLSAAGVLSANLPIGTTFVSATGGGSYSSGHVVWNINSIDPGATQHYSFTVSVASNLSDGTLLESQAQLIDGTLSLARASALEEVRAKIPLELRVIANPDPAAMNGAIFYEIKISNTGNSTLSNVVLTDVTQGTAVAYPSQSTGGASCSGANACGNGVLMTWPALTLAPGQTQTLWVSGAVSNGTANGSTFRNQATLSYPGGSVCDAHDVAVDSAASLHLGITPDHDPVHAGENVTFELVVGNTGNQSLPLSAASVLSATLPVGTTLVASSGNATASAGVVKWSIGSVNPGATQHYTFTVRADASLADGTLLRSLVQLLDGTTSVTRAAAMAEVRAVVPLKLVVTPNPDPVAMNGGMFYQVKISNIGGATLSNIVLTDVMQGSGVVYPSQTTGAAACSGASACGAGTLVTWPAFTLSPGQTQTLLMSGAVNNGTLSGALVRNQATLAYPGGSVLFGHDFAVDNAASLHLGMVEGSNPVKPGMQLTYTLTLGNTGNQNLPLSAAGVLVATLPPGTSFVSASNGGVATSNSVEWAVGSVNPGSTQHYTFTVNVDSSIADGSLLQSQGELWDATTSLTRAHTTTEVRASTPLTLAVTESPDPSKPNAMFTYSIVVTNNGTSALSNITLIDQLWNSAAGIVANSTGGYACNGASACGAGALGTWPAFSLTSGQSQTVSMTGSIANATANGTVVRNQILLTYPGGTVLTSSDLSSHN